VDTESLTSGTAAVESLPWPVDLEPGERVVFVGERPAVRHPKVRAKKPKLRIGGASIRRRFVTTRCEAALITNWRLILVPAKKPLAGMPSTFILSHEALDGVQEARRSYAEKATQERDAALAEGKHLGGLVTGWKAIREANEADLEAQKRLGHGPAVVTGVATRRHAVPAALNLDALVYGLGWMILAPLFIPGVNFFYVFVFLPLFVCWEVFGRLLAGLDRALPSLGLTAWQSALVSYGPADLVAGQVYESLTDRTSRRLVPRTHAQHQDHILRIDSFELRLDSKDNTGEFEQALRRALLP
jgi:hypothetical protein